MAFLDENGTLILWNKLKGLLSKVLPEVTASDNGKILTVVGAKWVAAENTGGSGTAATDLKVSNETGATSLNIAKGEVMPISLNITSTIDGMSTGDVSCKITVNDSEKALLSLPQGLNTIYVQDYLSDGANNIVFRITDAYGNYRIMSFTGNVINLYLTSTFDDTVQYTDVIQFKYIAYGAIEKTTHVFVDDVEVSAITTSISGKQQTVNIPKQAHGTHYIEAYITAVIGDKVITSPVLAYDVMCQEALNNTVLISSVYQTTQRTQGELVSIPYIVLSPSSLTSDIELEISNEDGVYSTTPLTVDRTRQYWNTRSYPTGNVTFTIRCGDIEKSHTITVDELAIDIEAVTNDLELHLTALGRSNNEANPETWSFNDITTRFDKVNFKEYGSGWIADENGDTCLRLVNGANIEIDFAPFAQDFKTYGKTLEVEFAIRDVNNRQAVAGTCMSDGIGIEITSNEAIIRSEQSEASCNFCDERKVRIAFSVQSRSEYQLLSIFINGVLSATKQYPATDNFQQTNPINLKFGSELCGIDIYNIRVYNTALTFSETNNNYIADIPDIGEKVEKYEFNDIYDEYGNISYQKVKTKNSVMTIIGELPKSKGDKKTVIVKFEHLTIDGLDFHDLTVVLDVQGTSSQWYVVKNYKGKLSEAIILYIGGILTKVFCIKADYAESTSTHNTGSAIFMESLLTFKNPAQVDNPEVRTAIYGYPIVLFHQATENDEPVFIGKYNLNYDKGSEEAFGFTKDYDVESWETKNNTSDVCNFKAPIDENNWGEDYEARYPDGNTDISRFKKMHDWVVSTRRDTATGEALAEPYVDVDGVTHTNDTSEYRLAKFKTEFENYFEMESSLVMYIGTFVMLATDQRTKNSFPTYWGILKLWFWYWYDGDTIWGINNEGRKAFKYFHEDIDQIDGVNVYNGQDNVFWNNFRIAFADKIQAKYQELRSNGKLTEERIIACFITNGSDKWSGNIYNEDSWKKYIAMLLSDNDASNLYQVHGTGEEELRYFVRYRLMYCDSKWYATDFADDYIALRINTPDTWNVIEPIADIVLKYFSAIYGAVRYKANGALLQQRIMEGEQATFVAPDETFNDTETAVYGASQISEISDLAPLYLSYYNAASLPKVVSLKIGDEREGYDNPYLEEVMFGTCPLLQTIDIRNCSKLAQAVSIANCTAIRKFYATGTSITGVELPRGCYIDTLHLPSTIKNLTLQDLLYLEDLQIAGYENIESLNIENCPLVDSDSILESCTNVKRVRLTNVNWNFDDASFLLDFVNRGIGGIDENGLNVATPRISGKCHIETVGYTELSTLRTAYPYLEITYDVVTMYSRALVERTISGAYRNDRIETVGAYAFYECDNLTSVSMANCTNIGESAFRLCENITTINAPNMLTLGNSVFEYCNLTSINFPVLEKIGSNAFARNNSLTDATLQRVTTVANGAFSYCYNLEKVDFPVATTITSNSFTNDSILKHVILRNETMCALSNINAFTGTHIASGTGYIYVPSALIEEYKVATNWSTYADQFRALEDWTVDGTVTGELDWDKIGGVAA